MEMASLARMAHSRAGILLLVGLLVAACGVNGYDNSSDVAKPRSLTSSVDQQLVDGREPMVVAHRGCWREAQENSLAAIEACIELGVSVVELDVRRTSDGVLVLMHDETVDRTTNGQGRVEDLTFSALSALRLKSADGGPAAALSEETVPTLSDALNIARNRILINVDTKSDEFRDVVALVTEMNMLDHVIMKLEVPPADPQLQNAPFIGNTHFMPKITQNVEPLSVTAPTFAFTNPVAYELKFETEGYLTEGRATIEALNARIWVNTLDPRKCAYHDDSVAILDPAAHWGVLLGLGVNMIQTDYPRELTDYLGSR